MFTTDRPDVLSLSASIALTTAWVKKIVPRKLMSRIASKFSTLRSRKSPRTTAPMPALLTRQSMPPKCRTTSSTASA
jgi:hypothetical protein